MEDNHKEQEKKILLADDEVLTEEEAAAFLKVAKITLLTWRKQGKAPPYCMIGSTRRYLRSSLIKWLKEHEWDV